MLAEIIFDLRSRANLTQREFAILVGVSLPTVKAWESGRFHSLSTESQHKIQQALGLSPEEVLDFFFKRIPPRGVANPAPRSSRAGHRPKRRGTGARSR